MLLCSYDSTFITLVIHNLYYSGNMIMFSSGINMYYSGCMIITNILNLFCHPTWVYDALNQSRHIYLKMDYN